MPKAKDVCEVEYVHENRVKSARRAFHDDETLIGMTETFGVLSDPTRLKIVLALSKEELYVCDIASERRNVWADTLGSVLYVGTMRGVYAYNLITITSVGDGGELPSTFRLFQNFPNPFNPSTTIKYALPERASVRLSVYDVLGREVMTLVQQEQEAGVYSAEFRGDGLTSGVYYYRLTAGRYNEVRKMIMLK